MESRPKNTDIVEYYMEQSSEQIVTQAEDDACALACMVERLQAAVASANSGWKDALIERNEALAEVERLQAALKRIETAALKEWTSDEYVPDVVRQISHMAGAALEEE